MFEDDRRRIRIALATGNLASAWSSPAAAYDDHAASRSINGVRFLLPALSDSAFVMTEFGLRQGVAYESVGNFPLSSAYTTHLHWVALNEQATLSLRIAPWLAVFTEVNGSASFGLDVPSLAFSTKDGFSYGGRAGLAVRVVKIDHTRTQVTLRGYGSKSWGRTLDLMNLFGAVSVRAANDLVQKVAQTRDLAQLPLLVRNELYALASSNYTNVVLERDSSWSLGYGVYLAQGIVGPLTLQGSFGFEHTRANEVPFDSELARFVRLGSHDLSLIGDAVLSADFSSWGLPVGISAEYAANKTFRTVAGAHVYVPSTQNIGGGLFYTGRRGLELGALLFTARNLKPLPGFETAQMSEKPIGYSGYFVLRALW